MANKAETRAGHDTEREARKERARFWAQLLKETGSFSIQGRFLTEDRLREFFGSKNSKNEQSLDDIFPPSLIRELGAYRLGYDGGEIGKHSAPVFNKTRFEPHLLCHELANLLQDSKDQFNAIFVIPDSSQYGSVPTLLGGSPCGELVYAFWQSQRYRTDPRSGSPNRFSCILPTELLQPLKTEIWRDPLLMEAIFQALYPKLFSRSEKEFRGRVQTYPFIVRYPTQNVILLELKPEDVLAIPGYIPRLNILNVLPKLKTVLPIALPSIVGEREAGPPHATLSRPTIPLSEWRRQHEVDSPGWSGSKPSRPEFQPPVELDPLAFQWAEIVRGKGAYSLHGKLGDLNSTGLLSRLEGDIKKFGSDFTGTRPQFPAKHPTSNRPLQAPFDSLYPLYTPQVAISTTEESVSVGGAVKVNGDVNLPVTVDVLVGVEDPVARHLAAAQHERITRIQIAIPADGLHDSRGSVEYLQLSIWLGEAQAQEFYTEMIGDSSIPGIAHGRALAELVLALFPEILQVKSQKVRIHQSKHICLKVVPPDLAKNIVPNTVFGVALKSQPSALDHVRQQLPFVDVLR